METLSFFLCRSLFDVASRLRSLECYSYIMKVGVSCRNWDKPERCFCLTTVLRNISFHFNYYRRSASLSNFRLLGPWKKSKEQLNSMCSALRINWESLSFTNLAMFFRWGGLEWGTKGSRLKLWMALKLDVPRHVDSCWGLTQTKLFW